MLKIICYLCIIVCNPMGYSDGIVPKAECYICQNSISILAMN